MGERYSLVNDFTTVLRSNFEVSRAMQRRDPVTGQTLYTVDPAYRANVEAAIMRGSLFPDSRPAQRGVVRHVTSVDEHQASQDAVRASREARQTQQPLPSNKIGQ
jgi:hypothetical protein